MKKLIGFALTIATGSLLLTSCGGGMTDEERMAEANKRFQEKEATIRMDAMGACDARMASAVDIRVAEMVAKEQDKSASSTPSMQDMMTEMMGDASASDVADADAEKEMSDEEWITAEVNKMTEDLQKELESKCDDMIETAALAEFDAWKTQAAAAGKGTKPAASSSKTETTTTETTETDPKDARKTGTTTATDTKEDRKTGSGSTATDKKESRKTGGN